MIFFEQKTDQLATLDFRKLSMILRRKVRCPIVLVGMMASGKSSIGWRLADDRYLGLGFFDSDAAVEEEFGQPIKSIYALWGEASFRDAEKIIIERILKNHPACVLSTGDGSFLNPEIREMIQENAVSIWLHSKADIVFDRVLRRLLKEKNLQEISQDEEDQIRQNLKKIMDERDPIYRHAHIHIESNDDSHDETMRRILLALDSYF